MPETGTKTPGGTFDGAFLSGEKSAFFLGAAPGAARGLYEPPRAALTGLDNLNLPAWLCFACAFLGITNPVLLGNKSFPVLCVGLAGRCKPPRGFGLENPLAYRHRLNNGA